MYDVKTANLEVENFHAGSFPIATDVGTVEANATIRKHAPIIKGANGLKEVDDETIAQVIGIAAAEPSDNEVVYYLTGEFFENAIVLPEDVTLEALKPVLRQNSIFLKEARQ